MPFFRSLVVMAMATDAGPWARVVEGERQPSSVTTTVSSMRTPPCSGRYTPGSTVTTWPAASVAVGRRADPRVLVDVEAHAVAGAVDEGVGPAGVGDDVAAGGVDVRAVDAGPHRGHAGAWARRPRRASAAASACGSPTHTVRVMSEQ